MIQKETENEIRRASCLAQGRQKSPVFMFYDINKKKNEKNG